MANGFHQGQRWISETEPELGLGSVELATDRLVRLVFPASSETRQYAIGNAPLRRVRFRVGDTLKTRENVTVLVENVSERRGLIFYSGSGMELCETELNDAISFDRPEERLLNGRMDPPEVFDLRVAALKNQNRRRRSKVRGFVGGRIDLIPHQLYIASEVSARLAPRVLLADEVGLGKTIEACLILHRLIMTGRAQRVLILVPESLVHQWFVELLRRFNLWFHIFDEERCDAIETGNPEANPFLDEQLVLCGIDLFSREKSEPTNHTNRHELTRRAEQAVEAGWDILVVDEAHHLGWSPESTSPEYAIVEAISRKTPGLLLLTATPEQLGIASHFARLRLLDPDRYYDLQKFIEEAEQYREVAQVAEKLLSGIPMNDGQVEWLSRLIGEDEAALRMKLGQLAVPEVRDELVDAMLDRHGTGRVMFRNTRGTIAGFPKRIACLHPLEAPSVASDHYDALGDEFAADTSDRPMPFNPEFSRDPRIAWLAELLRANDSEKVLLICRSRRKAEAIESALRQAINVNMAVFHEGRPLIQRDRNAAWFADEEGARILICSEIGSEGRNFQFSHHLVLFDLPLDPELLEQRIGRLDRIGQRSEIQVHVPFAVSSPQEVLARWYHEGLNAFEKNLHGGRALLEQFGARVHDLAQDFHETMATKELDQLVRDTQVARAELAERLEKGRDRLLELNSFRPDAAARLVHAIREQDDDRTLDTFMFAIFDHYSIHFEELASRTYQLGSAGVFADSFPGLTSEGLTVTSDRQRALAREDVQFLTWDHPLVTGALDLLLGSEQGNSSYAFWPDTRVAGLYLEAVFVLECIAPPALHVDRFLPPAPIRVVVDHRGEDVTEASDPDMFARQLKRGNPHRLLERPELRDTLLPMLLEKAHEMAEAQFPPIITRARAEMRSQLEHEISRLIELRKVNQNVREEEIELLARQRELLDRHMSEGRLRLDSVRLIQRGQQG